MGGSACGHQKLLPWKLHWLPIDGKGVDQLEGQGVDLLGGIVGRGGVPIPTDILCWSSKFSPTGVVFFPAHLPRHQGFFLPAEEALHHCFLPELLWGGTAELLAFGSHPPGSQTDGVGYYQPHSVCLR